MRVIVQPHTGLTPHGRHRFNEPATRHEARGTMDKPPHRPRTAGSLMELPGQATATANSPNSSRIPESRSARGAAQSIDKDSATNT